MSQIKQTCDRPCVMDEWSLQSVKPVETEQWPTVLCNLLVFNFHCMSLAVQPRLKQQPIIIPMAVSGPMFSSFIQKRNKNTENPFRRKFRSKTSDYMDRWKSRGESNQRRARVTRKKMQVRAKALCFSNHLWPRRVEK